MDFINLKSLNLTAEGSEGLIKFLAQKRGITTKKLLSTIKLNLKRKNNKDLVSKSQQKLKKQQQTLSDTRKIRNSLYNNNNNNNNNNNKLDKKIIILMMIL